MHGEILGVSLLLEDVISTGIPKISFAEPISEKRPGSRISSRPTRFDFIIVFQCNLICYCISYLIMSSGNKQKLNIERF